MYVDVTKDGGTSAPVMHELRTEPAPVEQVFHPSMPRFGHRLETVAGDHLVT